MFSVYIVIECIVYTYIALWSSYVQQLFTPEYAIETGVKRFRQILEKNYKNVSGPFRPLWLLWPLRLKTHFLLCTSLYLKLKSKTYFAILISFLCGVWGYVNQLFRLNFDYFTVFWKNLIFKIYRIKIYWLPIF